MEQIAAYIVVGFIAQMIDGTLGMAYGVTATSFLLTLGMPPAIASASVHAAEVVTTWLSGLSHARFGNVDGHLVKRLVIPGVIGAVSGAYILASVPGMTIKPFVAAYLLVMGLVILLKALRKAAQGEVRTRLVPLGLIGGFLDAVGGGGWGPIVTSTLVARGNDPRFTIGSVNFAEFFVTLSASATFVLTIGLSYWHAIIGLAIGGAIAAPFAAYTCKKAPTRVLMLLVGVLIIGLSIRTLSQVFR
ncbi:MAG: sulfite exporter TauE/SafE family protein [bacterium]|nr:sulfite exporter TauE/SafE family protein [bacterium]